MKADVHTLDALAERLAHDAGGASLHGAIVGGLCADLRSGAHLGALLQEALDIHPGDADCGIALGEAAAAIEQDLRDPDYGFALGLPDDEETLAERARALGAWCDAFVAVFAVCLRRLGSPELSGQAEEILGDIGSIAGGLDPQALDCGEEEDERDFHEIAEFVRLAALGIFAERAAPAAAALH